MSQRTSLPDRTATPDTWAAIPGVVASAPLHEQVAAAIRDRIASGALPPGSPLPPELELARRFRVSRHTMRAGLAALVTEGLLERHRGRGTVVTRPRIEQSLARFYSLAREMRARGMPLETRVLARGRLGPGDALATPACLALALDDPAAVGYLRRVRLVEGTPLQLETLTFPADLCPDLLAEPRPGAVDPGAVDPGAVDPGAVDPGAQPFYEVLADRVGLVVTRASETLRPVAVAGHEARVLQIAAGTPVFDVERISYAGERPIEWRCTLVRGDRYQYVIDLVNPQEYGDAE
jgi:GntR family transcriptional regulator